MQFKRQGVPAITRPHIPGDNGYRRPENITDLHRPVGSPTAREIESQQAQLKSVHRHGTGKDIKWGMACKTGLREVERED
ncbi:hypothetical protein [Desulfotomaculum copahuensis]|uniref:Uncharacterized protein n=1 Tax=Desulfotomaculum copahuensis TaxID=1838280 RepID=A0A1B7LJH0_9FIRM|nr:hypothetical protein [Desulfotomaculum copahuensis]OAT86715.1 hypothetical protein A6M21_02550 [Desulfotomaculum copahuensis]